MLAGKLVDIAAVEFIPDGPIPQRSLEMFPSGDVVGTAPHVMGLYQRQLAGLSLGQIRLQSPSDQFAGQHIDQLTQGFGPFGGRGGMVL